MRWDCDEMSSNKVKGQTIVISISLILGFYVAYIHYNGFQITPIRANRKLFLVGLIFAQQLQHSSSFNISKDKQEAQTQPVSLLNFFYTSNYYCFIVIAVS